MNRLPELLTPLRWTAFATSLAILLVTGWVHGQWSGRWQSEDSLLAAVARVEEVPMEIGDWKAEAEESDRSAFFQTGARGYWTRKYTHASSKHSLLVILMCGRAGRMSVHTPEVCYQGAGYKLAGMPEPWTVQWQASVADAPGSPEIVHESSGSFWTAQFRKDAGFSGNLRLFWSWNNRGTWQALSSPRWETRGEKFLYKMYISHETVGSDTHLAQEFMQEFLPVLQKTLFPKLAAE